MTITSSKSWRILQDLFGFQAQSKQLFLCDLTFIYAVHCLISVVPDRSDIVPKRLLKLSRPSVPSLGRIVGITCPCPGNLCDSPSSCHESILEQALSNISLCFHDIFEIYVRVSCVTPRIIAQVNCKTNERGQVRMSTYVIQGFLKLCHCIFPCCCR